MSRPALWPLWGPTVRAAEFDGPTVSAGATGTVVTFGGLRLPFRITDVEPARRWSWKVAGVEATGHEVRPLGAHRCQTVFTVPWPFLPYALILRVGLRRLKLLAEADHDASTPLPLSSPLTEGSL